MFDYTPIVSGYIKSIEQLLHEICVSYRNSKKLYCPMSSFTLGSYTNFINENELILRTELQPDKKIIIDCLDSYRIESRNHLFHKDFFNNWDRVEIIRENTIFLYVALLGAVEPSLIANGFLNLRILDDNYDQLFKIISNEKTNYYSITLKGKEYHGLQKVISNKGLLFNKNGQIKNTIKFKIINDNRYEIIELSRRNMPSEVWIENIIGNKIKKIWPIANCN